jgi:hypothetical protein
MPGGRDGQRRWWPGWAAGTPWPGWPEFGRSPVRNQWGRLSCERLEISGQFLTRTAPQMVDIRVGGSGTPI